MMTSKWVHERRQVARNAIRDGGRPSPPAPAAPVRCGPDEALLVRAMVAADRGPAPVPPTRSWTEHVEAEQTRLTAYGVLLLLDAAVAAVLGRLPGRRRATPSPVVLQAAPVDPLERAAS